MSKGCAIARQNGCWLSFFVPWFVSFLRAFTKLGGAEQVQADWKEQVALYHHGCCLLKVWYSHSHWPLLVLEREWLPPIPVASTKLCMCKEGPLDSPSLMSVLLPFVSFLFSLQFTRSCLLSLSKSYIFCCSGTGMQLRAVLWAVQVGHVALLQVGV